MVHFTIRNQKYTDLAKSYEKIKKIKEIDTNNRRSK